jgi:NitT/TauT family transport system permease protein
VVASVPATALFPLFIFAFIGLLGSTIGDQAAVQIAAILMLTTGMLWYLFFNILSGLRAVPPDLEEAARSYGLSRRMYYQRLLLPAIFPAFITGSITAFGGGWNTLIIAEYINYSPTEKFHVLGVGYLLDKGALIPDGAPLLASALLVLIVVVVTLNELLWKPLYRRAAERYRIE